MRLLVTGGAGFVCTRLVNRLVEDGYQITALDNIAMGRLENLTARKSGTHFSLIGGSIADQDLILNRFIKIEK